MNFKKLPSLVKKVLLSLLLSLFFTPFIVRHIENNQIDRTIQLLDAVMYAPQLELEKRYNNDIAENKKSIDEITVKHPQIRSIYYIENGHFSYGSNNNKTGLKVPKYIQSVIDSNLRSQLLTDPYNKNKINYLFKFGSGYYLINFYLNLLQNSLHSDVTNCHVNNTTGSIDKVDYFWGIQHYSEHLNMVVDSGLIFEKLILLILSIFILIFMLISLISFKLNTIFDVNKMFIRKIKKAVKREDFIPYYQSVFSIKKNRFVSAEVLCRWNDNGQIISPFEFIDQLEKMNEIKSVTLSLMRTAFKTVGESNVSQDFTLSFNFTVNMILDNIFMEQVIEFINHNPLVKNKLVIELTESENNFLHLNEIRTVMFKLKKEGILLSIDDVGTGYSNLITIQELPFDIMKIDRCFISSKFAVSNSNMLETLSTLGKSMGLIIVAEGIETIDELERLYAFDIDLCQGYYFSKPCDSLSFIKLHKNTKDH